MSVVTLLVLTAHQRSIRVYERMETIDGFTAESRASRLLHGLGFAADEYTKPVKEFSGGWRMRLNLARALMCRSDILLLDEPTNHLDLEMRQALSVALIEYTGALVLISHDRHLLRSVCDELLIIHDGIVDRFNRSLDDYPTWLREQEEKFEQSSAKWQDAPAKTVNKKQQRQEQAQRRRRLKPLYDKVQDVEKDLAALRIKLTELDARLADESIYVDANRKDELSQLVQDQAEARSAIESLEWKWLEASEKLEQAT